MTARQIFEIAMSLIDERLDTGIVDPNTTLTFQKNTPFILTSLQDEILEISDFTKSFEIERFSVKPLVGSFKTEQHDKEDVIKEASTVAYSYSFEANGDGVVYIEDYTTGWNVIKTINITGNGIYGGLLTPTTNATKTRIRFSGTGYYIFKNWALFKESTIIVYRPYVGYAMPNDFHNASQIVEEEGEYADKFKWEGNVLMVPYEFSGTYRVLYRPIPAAITTLDDVMTLDDITCRTTLANGLASRLLVNENKALANFFGDIFTELKRTPKRKKPAQSVTIKDYYDSELHY